MPRRHPRPEKTPGPSVARQNERRERRRVRREAKSPDYGIDGGLLTASERQSLQLHRGEVKSLIATYGETPELVAQLGNLERELELDRELRYGSRSAA